MGEAGRFVSLGVMYFIQTLINLIIPSGSAKAALTMPIMAPFSDVIGPFAASYGDGLSVWRWLYEYDNTYFRRADGGIGNSPHTL